MTVRPLRQDDAAPAAAIHHSSFDTPWDADTLAGYIARDLCLGLFEGGSLRAFGIITCASDQGDILTIATAPEARGKGHGATLLRALVRAAKARGVGTVFLEVAVDNMAALALYRRAGFHGVGKRPAYYKRAQGRVSALILRKDLT